MKAIHLLIATLIMMSLHPAQQKVVTPLTTQVQRIFWKERMAPEVLHTIFTKLLQKSEMRKDIVIELSYKGFS